MEKLIDLHIHSNISDGVLSPKEIIDEAVKNNVNTVSICDHDSVEAYTNELFEYAKKNSINLITGVEITTQDTVGVHVLGYNIDLNNKDLLDTLYKLKNSRHIYLHDVSKKLNELGYIVNEKELDKIDTVTKAHIALDILNNKENKQLLIKTFGHIPNMGEFIETIMIEGCPAYIEKKTISPKEASEIIKKANGKVVLAHPVSYKYENNLNIEDVQQIVDKMNPDGIEAYYHYVDRYNNKVDEVNKWLEFAKKNNKFVTIGSDFHKKDGIRPEIGLINYDIDITTKEIDNILNCIKGDKHG
ncbi:MAG: PHP domain-containing protein [Bacilli bacterium]|nr:PHP domain-containing protein [Bacilli bacterium]